LPDADPKARDPRALAVWADAFERHIGASAWGQFAAARVHELFPDPSVRFAPTLPKAATPAKSSAKGAKAAPKPATKPATKTAVNAPAPAPRPRVNVPRRESSDLARLMETTTGMTSLQETLQTERWLAAASEEPATVPLAEVKPPPLPAHPFAAMLA